MSAKLIAFHGSPAIKEKYLARIRAHVAADELIHGTGWSNGKGCAVGCTLNAYYHAAYETELGIPMILAHLEDNLFEAMHNGESKTWPERFLQGIPVGADLEMVWPRFALWLMDEVAKVAGTSKGVVEAVRELYREWIETGVKPSLGRWAAAWAAAARAAEAAARAAAEAAAAWAAAARAAWAAEAAEAAEAAAWVAAGAAEAAAGAAEAAEAAAEAAGAEAAARAAAGAAAQLSPQAQSIKLLELLSQAPVVEHVR